MTPSFLDARGIIAAAESAREGFDPILNNPHDPMARPANYPRLWYWPFLALNIHDNSTAVLGFFLAATFYGCIMLFVGRLRLRDGFIWGFFLCAPPTMLALERGNNDVVVFILLTIALIARRFSAIIAAGSYTLLGLCAALKLYPAAAFCLAVRERTRLAWTMLTLTGLTFVVYIYTIREQIKAISRVLPHPYKYAYGYRVFADWCNADDYSAIPWFLPFLALLVVFAFAGVTRLHSVRIFEIPRSMLDGLMVGSSLYLFTFVLNNNSNYRLIFLLFTFPALLHLAEGKAAHQGLAKFMLISMSIGWVISCQMLPVLFVIKEAANWIVFGGMMFLWLECVPWSRRFGFRPIAFV